MPSTGAPSATRFVTTGPAPSASIPAMQAAYAPTPGTTRPSAAAAAARSLVTVTSTPGRATARSAERKLPDPESSTTTDVISGPRDQPGDAAGGGEGGEGGHDTDAELR